MLKKKKNRALLAQKKRADTSVIVNTELSDPRPQSLQRQPSVGLPSMASLSAMPQQPHNDGGQFFGLGAMALAAANGQPGVPNLSKKGPKAPPHRPGALPMPPGYTPGMDIKGMLNPAQSSSSFIDAKRGKKGGLVSP